MTRKCNHPDLSILTYNLFKNLLDGVEIIEISVEF